MHAPPDRPAGFGNSAKAAALIGEQIRREMIHDFCRAFVEKVSF